MDQSRRQAEISGQKLNESLKKALPQSGDPLPPASEPTLPGRWDGKHFINVRLSIPLIFTRLYVTFVVGKERRSKSRRRAERAKHPLGTFGNAFFLSTTGTLIGLACLAVLIVATVVVIRELFSVDITLR